MNDPSKPTDDWSELYRDLGARARAADDVARATDQVMAEVARVARLRADELRQQTGVVVSVDYPSHKPIALSGDGPFMSFLRLRADARSLHVYSHRGTASGLPAVHILYSITDASARRRRVESELGFFIAADERGHELRAATQGEPRPTIDGLVLRAFRLLLGQPR
jgi:hypothetical protein